MDKFQKYQQIFLKNVTNKVDEWHQKGTVEEHQIYKFLHSIKGTAASIGLPTLSVEAGKMLDKVMAESTANWEETAWTSILQPVLFHVNFDKDLPLQQRNQSMPANDVSHPTILILENDIDFLQYFRENLEIYGYNILVAATEDRALTLFYDEKPDLLVIDYYLNDTNGLKVLEQISAQANSLLTPVMIISAESSNQLANKVYQTTALDFITKPMDFDLLDTIIKNRLNHVKSLKKQITTDKLTKAYNRTYLNDLLDRMGREYKRNHQSFSLAMLDLDDFKQVNDTYGHVVGDQVLINLADILNSKTRPEDTVIRYGGEEFMILMPGIDAVHAKQRLTEVLDYFKTVVHTSGEHQFQLSFTAGVTEMAASINKMEELVVQSDLALYRGKRSGKGIVNKYHAEIDIPLGPNQEEYVHISIVDDDSIIREMLKERLQSLSFFNKPVQVTSYTDGHDFLQANHVHKGKHVVLLDGVMPDMDGLDVLTEIRANDQETIVVMLTGRQKDQDIILALQNGADDYMTKPFSTDELVARITRIINRYKGGKR